MSYIGRQPILIPKQVEVKIDNGLIQTKGIKGSLSFSIPSELSAEIKENQVFIFPKNSNTSLSKAPLPKTKAVWGLTRVIIANNIKGVSQGHKKELQVVGVGYKANIQDKKIILLVGFSHPVEVVIPANIECAVKKDIIIITGIDKQAVGEFAAQIRNIRKPEPYKGKGIRYLKEVIKMKQGKKAVAKKAE
jgi:large subunit ribosomal protein L6